MPELPEVETVRLQLCAKVIGKTIARVTVFEPKTVAFRKDTNKLLSGRTIAAIKRIGKLLIFEFEDTPDLFLLAHLKMTGQFFFVDAKGTVAGGGHSLTAGDTKQFPGRHTRVAFNFTDGSALYFNDMRKFGYTKLANAAEVARVRASYGVEPIQDNFSITDFSTKLKKKQRVIKAVLLDQTFVAGLGNIYVDEALWRSYIKPTRRAATLTKREAIALATAAKDILEAAIKVGGTTFKDFAHTDGEHGNFTDYLAVFARQGQPCLRCKSTIKKVRVAGRGTHYCATCQR